MPGSVSVETWVAVVGGVPCLSTVESSLVLPSESSPNRSSREEDGKPDRPVDPWFLRGGPWVLWR